jgi:hypothetical protein
VKQITDSDLRSRLSDAMASDRVYRLCAVAMCRMCPQLDSHHTFEEMLRWAEQKADRDGFPGDWSIHCHAAREVYNTSSHSAICASLIDAVEACGDQVPLIAAHRTTFHATLVLNNYWVGKAAWERELPAEFGQTRLNQWRQLNCLLARREEREYPAYVRGLAGRVYWDRECFLIGILADALEEMGDVRASNHLRHGTHPRGCFVMDQILGLR